MASNVPSIQEIEKWTKPQLSNFLKSRGKQGFSSWNRPKLLEYAIQISQEEDMTIDDSILPSLVENRKIFDAQDLQWQSYQVVKPADFPKDFDMFTITNFLTNVSIDFGDEQIQTGIDRRAKKGRSMYTTGKIHMVEASFKDNNLLFRGNIEASMKNHFRQEYYRSDSIEIPLTILK